MITSLSLRHLTRLSRLEIRKLTLAGNFARASSMAFTLISNMRTVFLQQPSYSLLFPVTFMRRFISRFNPRQIRLQTFPCRCWAGHVRKQRQKVAFQVAEPLAPGCRLASGFQCEDDAESGAAMQAGSVFRSWITIKAFWNCGFKSCRCSPRGRSRSRPRNRRPVRRRLLRMSARRWFNAHHAVMNAVMNRNEREYGCVPAGFRLHVCRNTVCCSLVGRENQPSWARNAWRRRGCCLFVGL